MSKPVRRCALYTRKSSEEGLEQDFNSLDAQREACAAYVKSQASEGWRALDTRYDDGGFSGGSMERPALQRLLADIAAGKIDVVVVYKIDRLTRALADFARIVELFDRHDVSFVSVTQAFNTTSSMGRLTLNVLLSFAQFEREVTGERIRDKIAASKAKGMWMGGNLPLGYDLPAAGRRALVLNEAEAEIVRTIFADYLELGSVRPSSAGSGRVSNVVEIGGRRNLPGATKHHRRLLPPRRSRHEGRYRGLDICATGQRWRIRPSGRRGSAAGAPFHRDDPRGGVAGRARPRPIRALWRGRERPSQRPPRAAGHRHVRRRDGEGAAGAPDR